MFTGTIRSNLDPHKEYPEERLLEIIKLVGLQDIIADGGLDREVQEKGANFSLGTVQLLCLGRVLLKEPKVT